MPADEDKIIGKQIKVEPLDPPTTSIDTDDSLEKVILTSALSGDLKTDVFESFSTVAQTRESMYELIDTMGMDSTIAAAIETYAEDITQPNSKGDVFWAESDDAEVARYVNYLIKKTNIDKQAFSWAYNLVKYGDVYVRLLRDSDFENSKLFNAGKAKEKKGEKEDLKEDVNLIVSRKNDHYAFTVETQKNPNEMFELTKYGKSMGYIKASVNVQKDFTNNNEVSYYTKYNINKKDVDIYSPTEFVHACSEGSTSRADEELDIFFNDDDYENKMNAETFQVRRGTGILNDLFKVWRQLSLLENSVLLNRLTRSSIVRAIQMEVGDMPANQVMNVTSRVKNLIENKSALETNKRMSEYTNPGPIENTIVIPTRNGKGALTINQIGGEVDPKQLTDLDWFNNKLFGGIKIPKQYFGFTDDAAGFSGGQSLAQYSSRYGKAVKRFQQDLCQMVTDMMNLFLIDTKNTKYINNFKIKMQAPVTQEEIDRKQDVSNSLRNVSDIMNTLNDIPTISAKLKILKTLLSECLSDQEIVNILEAEIAKLEEQEKAENKPKEDKDKKESGGGKDDFFSGLSNDFNPIEDFPAEEETTETETGGEELAAETPAPEETAGGEEELPSPADLGVNLVDNV